jgi:hypothetical protein
MRDTKICSQKIYKIDGWVFFEEKSIPITPLLHKAVTLTICFMIEVTSRGKKHTGMKENV